MLIKGKTPFVYDIEVLPNFFSDAVINANTGNIKVFEISSRRNDIQQIIQLYSHKNIIFVGFNSIHYDNPIIAYIIMNQEELMSLPVWEINKRLKNFSDFIIHNQDSVATWKQYKYANLFSYLDLLTMMFASKLRVGLKELQVTMGYQNVREYEGDFNSYLPESEFDNVISYNINDILSTKELMFRLEKDIKLREDVDNTFGVNVLNMDGVNLGVEIIKHNYLKDTNKRWESIKDLRSPCHELDLKDVIFDFIHFETPQFQKLHKKILATHLNLDLERNKDQKDRWKITVYVDDLEITYSLGGIHTKNKPAIYKSDDEWIIIDSDCALGNIGAR